jgi:hypothetical protein
VEDAQEVMEDVLDLIKKEALPFFEQVETVTGFTLGAEERVQRQPDDPNYQEALFYLRLIQGDVEGALRTAEAAQLAAHTDGRPWALEIGVRVRNIAEIARRDPQRAVHLVCNQADQTRAHLGLPPRTEGVP